MSEQTYPYVDERQHVQVLGPDVYQSEDLSTIDYMGDTYEKVDADDSLNEDYPYLTTDQAARVTALDEAKRILGEHRSSGPMTSTRQPSDPQPLIRLGKWILEGA